MRSVLRVGVVWSIFVCLLCLPWDWVDEPEPVRPAASVSRVETTVVEREDGPPVEVPGGEEEEDESTADDGARSHGDPEPSWDPSELLVAPGDWPDHPVLDLLLDALEDGGASVDDLLDAGDALGLLDEPPSAHDDPWDRYAALWLMYAQLDFFDDDEGWSELHDEVWSTLQAAPDHPTSDALRVALLMLDDADSEELVYELLDSPYDDWADYAEHLLSTKEDEGPGQAAEP